MLGRLCWDPGVHVEPTVRVLSGALMQTVTRLLSAVAAQCSAGNVTKVKQAKKTLSNKEKKKRDRLRAARRKAGEVVRTLPTLELTPHGSPEVALLSSELHFTWVPL